MFFPMTYHFEIFNYGYVSYAMNCYVLFYFIILTLNYSLFYIPSLSIIAHICDGEKKSSAL